MSTPKLWKLSQDESEGVLGPGGVWWFGEAHASEPSLSEVVAGLVGLLQCKTCGGSGYGGDGGHEYNSQEEYEGLAEHVCRICPVPCPDCVGGLNIPDEWVEAGARAYEAADPALGFAVDDETWDSIKRDHPEDFQVMMTMMRAALAAVLVSVSDVKEK